MLADTLLDRTAKYLIFFSWLYILVWPTVASRFAPASGVVVYDANILQYSFDCMIEPGIAVKDGQIVGLGDADHLMSVLGADTRITHFAHYQWYRETVDQPYRLGEQVVIDICGPRYLHYRPFTRLGANAHFYLLDDQRRVVAKVRL